MSTASLHTVVKTTLRSPFPPFPALWAHSRPTLGPPMHHPPTHASPPHTHIPSRYVYYYRTDLLTPDRTLSWADRTVGATDTLLFERRTPHAVWWNVAGSDWTVVTVSLQ